MTRSNSGFAPTKGQTLSLLQDQLTTAAILPLKILSYGEFCQLDAAALALFWQQFGAETLIVRSSYSQEDSQQGSMAGQFCTVANVTDPYQLQQAVTSVFQSYPELTDAEEVLIQPQLLRVSHCGVLFSRDPSTGSPYYVIADDRSGFTDKVTAGQSSHIQTYYCWHQSTSPVALVQKLVLLVKELQQKLKHDALDIEYAIDEHGQLWLFQVRPLTIFSSAPISQSCATQHHLKLIAQKLERQLQPQPFLFGETTVFGVMPDWNPAEIIGLYPKPLALSLYKELITNSTWAYQRHNYGYRNLRSFPLMTDFLGLPYIDVRVSFNSFLPRDVRPALGHKLVNYYLKTLTDNPNQHDSVEFDIVLSCYTPDIEDRLQRLQAAGFSADECAELSAQLLTLTNKIIDARSGLWIQDLHRIEQLKVRHQQGLAQISDPIQRIYWLLEDCKRYGTLPFAGLARAAFIAIQLLQSLVRMNILTELEYQQFLASLTTVSGQMTADLSRYSKEVFLREYGHLRPGTYDLCSPRYDMTPERYFNFARQQESTYHTPQHFELSAEQYQNLNLLLKQHGLNHSPASLLHFIKSAIEGREYAKFIFTRSLSDAMEVFAQMAQDYGFSREDAAFADIGVIYQLISSADDPAEKLAESIKLGKQHFQLSSSIKLPPLISKPEQVFAFTLDDTEPNFVTSKQVIAALAIPDGNQPLHNKIVFIASADPGFDWIFSHQIAGFVTAFGGCNSHMAIRAAELGIPAVIGAGEQKFNQWKQANLLDVDCQTKTVRILQ